MLTDKSSHSKQGVIGLGAAIAYFTRNDFVVCVPLTDTQKYDLIVEKDDILERIQVKTTRFSRDEGYWSVQLRTMGGNRSNGKTQSFVNEGKADGLFILCEDGSEYLIPIRDIKAKFELILGGEKYARFLITPARKG